MAEEVLGGVRLDSAEATRALNALESKHDYVVFVAENELTPWSEKAIRQSDLVLTVGWHNSCDATPNALERLAAELLPPMHGGWCCCMKRAPA
jgi:NTE family protein